MRELSDKINRLRAKIGQCQNMIRAGYYVAAATRELQEAKTALDALDWKRAYQIQDSLSPC